MHLVLIVDRDDLDAILSKGYATFNASDQIGAIREDTFASGFPRINDPALVLQTYRRRYAYPAELIRCQANYCYLSEKEKSGGGS